MISGVYQIRNTVNAKCYIGSTVNIQERWATHLAALRHRRHYNEHLQRAFDKYGEDAFVFEVLKEAESETLTECEQYFLDVLLPDYNISPTAGSPLGVQHTDETRTKMHIARVGKRNPNYGKYHSEETKQKMRRAWTPKRRQAQSNRRQGKHHSARTRAKISVAKTGERNPFYGKHHSEETKRKMSEARKVYWQKVRESKNQ